MMENKVTPVIDSWADTTPVHECDPNEVRSIIKTQYALGYSHLSCIIAYDKDDGVCIDYPLRIAEEGKISPKSIFVRTYLPNSDLTLDSVEDIFPVALLYESELQESYGIKFNLQKGRMSLLLPDNFPDTLYPMRKEVSISHIKEELDRLNIGLTSSDSCTLSDTYTMAVGPQHPTHKEPIRFEFHIEGEEIKDVGVRIGFNYRGIEKALEAGTWIQNLYLIERICGICSSAHQLAYVTTVEKIIGIVNEVPEKAYWLRSLFGELERIHSHMLWYGVLAHDGGFDLMFHQSWRDREIVMDILEEISGNRVNYSIETIGGVRRDVNADVRRKILDKLLHLKEQVLAHQEILEKETTFLARLEGIGTLSHSDALKHNVVGPTARASGINYDLRKEIPYAAYKEIPFQKQTENGGDLYSSLLVRIRETIESVEMCIYILLNLPTGENAIQFKNRVPEGVAHTSVEAPRGEDFHFIRSLGGKNPDRHKIRAPTLTNLGSLLKRFENMQVADIPMIIRLIDPCIGCMERVSFIDAKSKKILEMSGSELAAKARKSHLSSTPIKVFG